MRKYFPLGILLLLVVSLSACATVAGNSPVRRIPESQATITGLKPEFANAPVIHQAVYNGTDQLDFFQYKEGWLDPAKMIRDIAEKRHQQSGGMPVETVLFNLRRMPKYHLLFQLADEGLVVYRIGVDVPPNLSVNFASRGALTFSLASDKEVRDIGIIVPQDFSPISDWHDSRRRVAVLSKDSNNGKPAGFPNILFVLMPKSSYGQRVVKVTPNGSMSFSGHASLALK